MIDAERAELIRLRDEGVVPDDVMRRVIGGDRRRGDRARPRHGVESVADREEALRPAIGTGKCEHLDQCGPTADAAHAGGVRGVSARRARRGCTCGCA